MPDKQHQKIVFWDFSGVIADTTELSPSSQKNTALYMGDFAVATMRMGLKEVMDEIAANHWDQAIISSIPTRRIRNFLRPLKNEDYFFAIAGGEIPARKSEKISKILKAAQLEPTDALLITDTLGDILEARIENVVSIAVTWGYDPVHTLEKGMPAAIVSSPYELEPEINLLLKQQK